MAIQLPPNSSGSIVDTLQPTPNREREVGIIGDAVVGANYLVISPQGAALVSTVADPLGSGEDVQARRLLESILLELQAINMSLASMVPAPILSSELSSSSMVN